MKVLRLTLFSMAILTASVAMAWEKVDTVSSDQLSECDFRLVVRVAEEHKQYNDQGEVIPHPLSEDVVYLMASSVRSSYREPQRWAGDEPPASPVISSFYFRLPPSHSYSSISSTSPPHSDIIVDVQGDEVITRENIYFGSLLANDLVLERRCR